LNFVKVTPKTLLVPFFSGHGVYIEVLHSFRNIIGSMVRRKLAAIWAW